jgi:hypothetical protein
METTVTLSPRAVFSRLWDLWPEELKVYLTIGLLADEEGKWRHPHALERLVGVDECYTSIDSVLVRLEEKHLISTEVGLIRVLDPEGIFKRRTRAQVLSAARVRKHRAKKKDK